MNKGKVTKIVSVVVITIALFLATISAMAEESEKQSGNRYYLGESVKTGWDNGYKGDEKITEGDVHFNWKIGEFYVDGFTSTVKGEDNTPIFLKNVGDKVQLWFSLKQNIDKLNNDENLSISEDSNGFDEYFSVPKTNFGRGALIIRKTDYTNAKSDPIEYKDYLAAKASPNADTEVELCEEGDYEVALDYEIKNDPRKIFDVSIIPTYSNYKIFFKFSVRNGNSMVYPFDVKTKGELSNTSVTENGFYLDFANSRYLDINIKKEVLNEGANGLAEDVRFNRPAKDGEEYTEEGIYTITSSNRYTGQLTTKRIYVGKNDVLKAVAATGLSVKDVNDYIANGAKVKNDGSIMLTSHETIPVDEANIQPNMATQDSAKGDFFTDNLLWFIVGGAALIVIIVVIIIVVAVKKRKKPKYVNIEAFTEDQEVE
ncbi:hypothetical protein [Ruminococcus sp. JL13D9]|uniref:hypothetical protein n=1 Tax=Ruminococcus sp. JL13D9 TaxID=3233381 RepID=UPI003899B94C